MPVGFLLFVFSFPCMDWMTLSGVDSVESGEMTEQRAEDGRRKTED